MATSLSTVQDTQRDRHLIADFKTTEIGCFSSDEKKEFHHDKRTMRYYVPPSVSDPDFALRAGYGSYIRYVYDEPNIDNILKWVMHNKTTFGVKDPSKDEIVSLNTDFICERGLLTRMMCVPYENYEEYDIAVTKFRDSYYMCELPTEPWTKQINAMIPGSEQDKLCYGGYKFEQYVTADTAYGVPDTTKPVDSNIGYHSVVRAHVNSHSLVYCGEVDALDPTMEGNNKYVELKTGRMADLGDPRRMNTFKRTRLFSAWAQSYILGVEKIVFGFRDDDSIVHKLHTFYTSQIPALIQDLDSPWDPAACLNFVDQFLNLLKSRIRVANPSTVYRVTWKPSKKPWHKAHIDPIKDVVCERQGRNSEFAFLPQWFVNWDAWSNGKV